MQSPVKLHFNLKASEQLNIPELSGPKRLLVPLDARRFGRYIFPYEEIELLNGLAQKTERSVIAEFDFC